MDHLFTIDVTPDENVRLNKPFQTSDYFKVDFNNKKEKEDDGIISADLDIISTKDSFETLETVNDEQAQQYKNIRTNIRNYIFSCLKNDGILLDEKTNNEVEESNYSINSNEGIVKLNLRKKKLMRIIEPLCKDRQKYNKQNTEENRYYNKDIEEIISLEKDKEHLEDVTKEREQTDGEFEIEGYAKGQKEGAENTEKEDVENEFECFKKIMNNTLLEKVDTDYDNINYIEDKQMVKLEKETNASKRNFENAKSIGLLKQKSQDSINKEVISETCIIDNDMKSTQDKIVTTTNEMENKGKDIVVNNDLIKEHKQENSKKRKMCLREDNEIIEDNEVEEIPKKSKKIETVNNNNNNNNDDKQAVEKCISNIVMSEFKKKMTNWLNFFPHINVDNFFFHLYFLVELWKDKKKACLHCGSTDCEIDENNKNVCTNTYCFLCEKKMEGGILCHKIRNQFNVLRRGFNEFLKKAKANYPFDLFGATCLNCLSSRHKICGTPPNEEGVKTIDFRSGRIYEPGLYNTIYSKDPFFIWDKTNKDYHRKLKLLECAGNYLNTKNGNEHTRDVSWMDGSITNRGRGSYYDERSRNILCEEQDRQMFEISMSKRKERHEHIYTSTGKRNYNESKYFQKENRGNYYNNGTNTNCKRSRESEFPQKKNNADLHKKNFVDISIRKHAKILENQRKNHSINQDYKRDNIQDNNKKNAIYNMHGNEQQETYRNPLFQKMKYADNDGKQRKWNYTKKENNFQNNFEDKASSKYRFFSSNSGKGEQNTYKGYTHGKDRDVYANKGNNGQRFNNRSNTNDTSSNTGTKHNSNNNKSNNKKNNNYRNNKNRNNSNNNNFNYYNDFTGNRQVNHFLGNAQVNAPNDYVYDTFFCGGNQNDIFSGGKRGNENHENKMTGAYKNTQNSSKYKKTQPFGEINNGDNSGNINIGYNRGNNANQNNFKNYHSNKWNNNSNNNNNNHNNANNNNNNQKNENNFRQNRGGDNNELYHNTNTRSFHRTKSNGKRKN